MAGRKSYVTTRDILIPAGTAVAVDTPSSKHFLYDRASILTAETKDNTSEWAMPLDEALAIGLVRED